MCFPRVGPEGWRAQNWALFSLSATIFFLSPPLLEVFSWNCGGVFHTLEPSKCARIVAGEGEKSEILGSPAGRAGPGRGRSTKTKKIIPARG